VNIGYNFLNLPQSITGSQNMSYVYDATGRKLRKVSGNVATDYILGIQYTNGSMDFVQTEEGRAIKSGSNWNYEYTLTDHLGNSRVNIESYNGAVRVTQEDEYYPFGLDRQRYTNGTKNKYLYNKKEMQDELGQYDYGARFYDPVIARWTSVDPSAEHPDQIAISPFVYGLNNPVKNIDPDGKCVPCLVELLVEGYEALTAAEVVTGGAFVAGGTAVTLNTLHRAGMTSTAPRDATYINNAPSRQAPAIVKANGTFGDKKDTESKTDREGLRNAKDKNGIPRSQQPDRTIKPGTPEGDVNGLDKRNEVQHEYTNSEGKKVVIRKDKPHEYGDGGKGDQGKHYNAGEDPKTQKDLNQHHNVNP